MAGLDHSTFVLRSTASGTIPVQARWNQGRVRMLCWIAKTASSKASITSAFSKSAAQIGAMFWHRRATGMIRDRPGRRATAAPSRVAAEPTRKASLVFFTFMDVLRQIIVEADLAHDVELALEVIDVFFLIDQNLLEQLA